MTARPLTARPLLYSRRDLEQNLAKLLGVLTPAAREKYVPLLCNLEMESDNWRFRSALPPL